MAAPPSQGWAGSEECGHTQHLAYKLVRQPEHCNSKTMGYQMVHIVQDGSSLPSQDHRTTRDLPESRAVSAAPLTTSQPSGG